MLKGLASQEATENFFAKKIELSKTSVKKCRYFSISSLGIGTYKPEAYKEENYTFSYKEAVKKAVELGCNHIDTAANYRYTKSEQEIGEALDELGKAGIKREELVIATKGGFLPLSYPFPQNPYHWINDTVVKSGLAKEDEIITDEHCMTPEFIEWSFEQSLGRLGVEAIDIFYLHNPEFELGIVPYEKIVEKFGAISKILEAKRKEGRLGSYGIASWNGFLNDPSHMEYLSLADFVTASRVHGDGFRFLQTPYNLAKPHGYIFANQKVDGEYMPAFYAAKKMGLEIVTSSSLLQMNIFKRTFKPEFRDVCGLTLASDLQRALQFARSNPLTLCALVGASSEEHALHDFLLLREELVGDGDYEKFFRLA
jgi:aryl-alcohol dehydrogenase-like predicted oxidoreductase